MKTNISPVPAALQKPFQACDLIKRWRRSLGMLSVSSASLEQFTVVLPPRFPWVLYFSFETLVINPGLWAQYGTKL